MSLIHHNCTPGSHCAACEHNVKHGGSPNHRHVPKKPNRAKAVASRKPLPVCSHLSPAVERLPGSPRGWQRCGGGHGSTTGDGRAGMVCGCPTPTPGVWRKGYECGEKCPGYSAALELHHNARCIGDETVAVYAACGLADATGRPVVLHARQAAWLAGVSHPGVTIRRGDGTGADCQADFAGEVRESKLGVNRVEWYCRQVARQLKVPAFTPVRPARVDRPAAVIGSGYVLLSPFANDGGRDWPAGRWRELAAALSGAGERVEATAGHWQAERLREVFAGLPVGLHAGRQAKHVLGLIAHASAVVANDSGLAHVAGLHGTPCVVVQAGWPAGHLHATAPSVREVRPVGGEGLAGISLDRVLDARDELAKHELNTRLRRPERLVGAGE